MRRLHIVGRKNHGKTTLCCELIAAAREHGLRVGSIKHTGHRHELDTPGKDSHQHRERGATPASIWSGGLLACYIDDLPEADLYSRLAPLYADCDLVLVEGDRRCDAPTVEVWRAERGTPPLAHSHPGIAAVISDDEPTVPCPIWRRSDTQMLQRLLALVAC